MSKLNVSYGLNNALQEVFPKPIVATRAPTATDKNFPIGQRWIDKSGNASYVLTSVASGSANWEGLGGGAATFTSVTSPLYTSPASSDLAVTAATGKSIVMTASESAPDAIDINATAGGIDIDAGGAINLTSAGAGVTIQSVTASNFTVFGAGQDLTLSSVGGSVKVSATENAANAISLIANGGTSETILIESQQGTGANAININSTAGGINVDAVGDINMESTNSTATAFVINASNASSGIDINAGSAGVDINSDLKLSGAGKQLQVTGGAATDFIGSATLSSGTVTVANTNIAAADHIFLAYQGTSLSNTGQLSYSISASTSFTIESTNASDANTVSYFIVREL